MPVCVNMTAGHLFLLRTELRLMPMLVRLESQFVQPERQLSRRPARHRDTYLKSGTFRASKLRGQIRDWLVNSKDRFYASTGEISPKRSMHGKRKR